MPTIPTIKGQVLIQLKAHLQERFGEKLFKKWLSILTPEEYVLVTAKLMPVSRIEAPLYDKLYRHGKMLFGGGTGEYYIPAFEYVGDKCLNSFMKFFIRMGTPAFVAHNAPLVWSHFFDTGRMLKVGGTSNSVELLSEGGEAYGEGLCFGIMGFGRMAILMSGGNNPRISHSECIYKNQSRCFFRFEWD